MNHAFLGCTNKVRVRVSTKNEERNGEEERKRESGAEKMKEIRVQGLLYKALDRVGSNPIQRPAFVAFGSRSYWIRINPTPLMRSRDPDPSIRVGLGRIP